MTIRECMLFIYNKKESITDEKELDFLDSVFTYLVDYYDYSKESKKEVITQSEIDAVIEGLDEEILNKIKDIKNDKNS
ncbi:hypothetical protein [Brachyspira murdochii]|uniref:hypothetical protein n=1 Tax=Brachyspira murdochii TaxID=84378 RepID=UPI003007C1C6